MMPPSGAQIMRVVRAPLGQARRVADERRRRGPRRLRAADPHLAHVREVEQPRALAHRAVLLEDAGVLDGHLPAGEVDQPAAQLAR